MNRCFLYTKCRLHVGSSLVLPQSSTKGQTTLAGSLGPSILGRYQRNWIEFTHGNMVASWIIYVFFWGEGERSSSKYPREEAMTSNTCQTQKAWNQQVSETVNSEHSCDLWTLERSGTRAGETKEAETSKAETRGKIKHSLFPRLRLPVCSWPWATTFSRGTVQL